MKGLRLWLSLTQAWLAGRRSAIAELRSRAGRRRCRGVSLRARTSLQSCVRRRDFLNRFASASTYRGLQAYSGTVTVAFLADGRRRKDDYRWTIFLGKDRMESSQLDTRGVRLFMRFGY